MIEEGYWESSCCSASPLGEVHEDVDESFGLCSQCRDHADFEWIEEEINEE